MSFDGRMSAHQSLAPGACTVDVSASTSGASSPLDALAFTIVRG